jgi:hypothetical protein
MVSVSFGDEWLAEELNGHENVLPESLPIRNSLGLQTFIKMQIYLRGL